MPHSCRGRVPTACLIPAKFDPVAGILGITKISGQKGFLRNRLRNAIRYKYSHK
jgi:hypothetical protein